MPTCICGSAATSSCSKCRSAYYCSKKCQAGHWKSAHKLVCGPSVRAAEELLLPAAYSGNLKQLERAITAGAAIDFRPTMPATYCPQTVKDYQGITALGAATINHHTAVVAALLAAGANVNACAQVRGDETGGGSPLLEVASTGHVGIARTLLAAGARVDARNNNGYTALIHAAGQGDLAMVTLLVEAGADINAVNADVDTALSAARLKLMMWDSEAFGMLARASSTADLKDPVGGLRKVIAYLESRGGRDGKSLDGRPMKGMVPWERPGPTGFL